MKKQFLHLGKVLNREEQKYVIGGQFQPVASCTADCGGGITVTCSSKGLSCSAFDYIGCASDEEYQECPPSV